MSGTDSWNAGMESIPANPCRFPYVVSALYTSSSRKQACWALAGSHADRSMRCAARSFSRKMVRKTTSPCMRGLPIEAEDLEVRVHVARKARDLRLVVHDRVLADVLDEPDRGPRRQPEDLRLVQPHRGPLVRPFDVDALPISSNSFGSSS